MSMQDGAEEGKRPTLEDHALATIEARNFLANVKPRTLRTTGGRVVTTEDIAKALVVRADIEHAVVPGTRPKSILCQNCKKSVKVKPAGGVPKRCQRCAHRARNPLNGGRPQTTPCATCKAPITIPKSGYMPRRCGPCAKEASKAHDRDRMKAKRAENPKARDGGSSDWRKKKNEQSKAERAQRKAAGLCQLCGKAPGFNGGQVCEACRDKYRKKKA